MSEFVLKDIRVAKEMPGFKSKDGTEGAQVLEFTLESADGSQKKAEMFTTPKSVLPNVGDKLEGEIEPQDNPNWAPKWVPAGSKKSSGFRGGRSPGETKAIQRQHSQEMALRYAAIVYAGGRHPDLEAIHELTNWFEADISGKQPKGITIDPLKSDVPADMSGTPFEEGEGR